MIDKMNLNFNGILHENISKAWFHSSIRREYCNKLIFSDVCVMVKKANVWTLILLIIDKPPSFLTIQFFEVLFAIRNS